MSTIAQFSHPKVNISDLVEVFREVLPCGHALLLLSSPGVGKTESAHAYGAEEGAVVVTMVASLLDRLDLAGLPHVTLPEESPTIIRDGRTESVRVARWAPNEQMAFLSKELNPNGPKTILYLTEFNAQSESTMPVFMRLINERAIGTLTLRDNVQIIADGNPASTNSSGRDLPEAMKRRFVPIVVETTVPAWSSWAEKNSIDARILAFFSLPTFARHLNDFDPRRDDLLTYATPAGWAKLSANKAVFAVTDDNRARKYALACGYVGVEAATALMGFLDHRRDLPDIGAILASPLKAELPKRPDLLSFIAGSIVEMARADKSLIEPALALGHRMITGRKSHEPEYGVFMLRLIARNKDCLEAIKKSKHRGAIAAAIAEDKALFSALGELV